MHFRDWPIVWFVSVGTLLGANTEWHTSPDKWSEPRIFHEPFDQEFDSRITVERCVTNTALPERQLAPNHAYWFAVIHPDRTKSAPWHSEALIYTEREYMLRITLRDIHYFDDICWVNEKLLRLRVWWGRICATDLIVDVERERIIYKEMVWDGTIAFQQYQEAKKTSRTSASRVTEPLRAETNQPPLKPVQAALEALPARLLQTSQARAGETYDIGIYVVKQGDTLPSIAQRHGLRRARDLVELNPELAQKPLAVGQQIRIYERLMN